MFGRTALPARLRYRVWSTSARAVGSGTIGTLAIPTGTSAASMLRAEIHEGIYPGLAIGHPYAFLLCFFFLCHFCL